MTTPSAPADLYRHSLRLLLDKDFESWVNLWDEGGTMEFPFAPPGWPERLEGKEEIAGYMHHYPDHIDLHDFPDLRIHQTVDPEVIVVEMRGIGRMVQSDAPFDMTYIAVVTIRSGFMMSYRDYWNPLIVLEPGADFVGGRP